MAIVKTIGSYEFIDEFMAIRPDNFTRSGLDILFDYLENQDGDVELDVIALCCEYEEASTQNIIDMFPDHLIGSHVSIYDALYILGQETEVIGYDEAADVIVFRSF